MAHGGSDKYYDPTNKVVYNAQIAEADDLNSINTAVDVSFGKVADDLDTLESNTVGWRDTSEKWAIDPLGTNPDALQPDKYSSMANALVAESYAVGDPIDYDGVLTGELSAKSYQVLTAADLAATNADVVLTHADVVLTGLDVATTNADVVLTNADVVTTAANVVLSDASKDKAQEWAENPEDVAVEPGEYSAYHWAKKAEASGVDAVKSVTGTTDRIDVDNTDPLNPIVDISASFVSGGQVDSVIGTTDQIDVDNTDPINPIISISPNFASGGGGLEWQEIQEADVTAESGKGYPVDTTTGEKVLTLPLSPVTNDQVGYKDAVGNFHNYPLDFDLNGELVEGMGAFRVNGRGAGGTLVYSGDALIGWLLVDATPMETVQTKPLIHVRHQVPSGTSGGGTSVGWTQRPLNVVASNDISGASLSGDEVMLPAGDYYVSGSSVIIGATRNKIRLTNGTSTLLVGDSLFCYDAYSAQSVSTVQGRITLTEPTPIQMWHYAEVAKATDGLGVPASTGDVEVYAELQIWRLDIDKVYPSVQDPSVALSKPLLHIQDQKAKGTDGGTSVYGNNGRVMNTVVTNEVSGASLTGGLIRLPAGKYYLDAMVSTVSATESQLSIYDYQAGEYILIGPNSLSPAGSGLTDTCAGQFTLTEESDLGVISYVNTGAVGAGLGVAALTLAGIEVYLDVKVWQVDALAQTLVTTQPINQPITGAYVTGNIFGGELEYVDADTFNVKNVSCMGDDTVTEIILDAVTAYNLTGATINTVYNVFAVKYTGGSFGIMTDTDVNGANLTGITAKRWLGFVKTNASGDICNFSMSGDELWFGIFDDNTINTLVNAPVGISTAIDISSFIPTSRVRQILMGCQSGTATTYLAVSSVAGNAEATMQSLHTGSNDHGDIWEWAYTASSTVSFINLIGSSIYWGRGDQAASSTVQLAVHAVKLRR